MAKLYAFYILYLRRILNDLGPRVLGRVTVLLIS